MNVGELKKLLDNYPDDLEVVTSRCSDYAVVDPSGVLIVKGVDMKDWVMRSHPTMSDENKAKEKIYLCLAD